MSERDKMLAGEWYDANFDAKLGKERRIAKGICDELNAAPHDQPDKRLALIYKLLQSEPENLELLSPFMVDYGVNINFGKDCFVNHFCYFMDGGVITIGDNVFFGPFVGLYTASHPLPYPDRNKGIEKASPITIGDNCWIGSNVSVMPGVTIGSGCVIGAGSVVTKDIPDNSLAMGVPAKVVSAVDQDSKPLR